MVVLPPPQGFQGKHHSEMYCLHYYRHWIRFIGPFIWLFLEDALLVAVAFSIFGNVTIASDIARHSLVWMFIALFLVAHFNFLRLFYRRFLYVVIVTDKRVHKIRKTLLMVDDHQSIDLWSLQDIHKSKHGLLQNFFGYGNITLEAMETVLVLHCIPSVDTVYKRLLDLQERARRTYAPGTGA